MHFFTTDFYNDVEVLDSICEKAFRLLSKAQNSGILPAMQFHLMVQISKGWLDLSLNLKEVTQSDTGGISVSFD